MISYLGTEDKEVIKAIEEKVRILGYTRLIRRAARNGALDSEEGRAEMDLWTKNLLELLDKNDTLEFMPYEIQVEADTSNLDEVTRFIEKHLENADCPMKTIIQINIAIDEIFSNIANYAYHPGRGDAKIKIHISEDPAVAEITFKDSGVPFNPLEVEEPDTTASADERKIGGLGIFMVKKSMDDLTYEYKDGENILTIKKSLS